MRPLRAQPPVLSMANSLTAGAFCLYPSTCTPGTGRTNYISSPGFVSFGYWKSLLLSLPWGC
jgi:hypothetical protein